MDTSPHGVAVRRPALPGRLPDGSPWPRIAVLVLGAGEPAEVAGTLASAAAQDYPEAEAHALPGGAALARRAGRIEADFLLPVSPGDRLAEGALAALALAAVVTSAEIVAGLRLVLDGSVVARVDAIAAPPGPLDPAVALAALAGEAGLPWRGGDVLLSRSTVEGCGGFSPLGSEPFRDLWRRLAAGRPTLARIGAPVLIQEAPGAAELQAPGRSRVAALNDTGARGGAGIAHRRLVDTLVRAGHDVAIHTLADESPPAAAEWSGTFARTEAALLAGSPDLVLAGNLHGATRTSEVLERLARQVPVAAVLHDLFLLTGRCNHPDGCPRIATGCDAGCPSPNLYPQLAPRRVGRTFAAKRRFLAGAEGRPPLLLANSRWTEDQARALAPAGTPVARIDLAFPNDRFRPADDKAALRQRLGLPADDLLIMFAAVIADQPGKGTADLVAALARVARPGIGFVVIGRIDDPDGLRLPNLHAPGPIASEAELAAWYGACDLHVTASRLETLGQTPIEAGLCGVPTVAYRATGLMTAVMHGVSGLLVEARADALARVVDALLAEPDWREALGACGRIALEGRNSHAAAYLTLQAALAEHGPTLVEIRAGRVVMDAAILPDEAGAGAPGREATVPPRPSRAAARLRRWKQRIWGRAQPPWMRRALYLADRLRRAAKSRRRRP